MTAMSHVPISSKGQIALPGAVRKALGFKPGMRVTVKLNGRSAQMTPALSKKPVSLKEIRLQRACDGPAVAVSDMRVTNA